MLGVGRCILWGLVGMVLAPSLGRAAVMDDVRSSDQQARTWCSVGFSGFLMPGPRAPRIFDGQRDPDTVTPQMHQGNYLNHQSWQGTDTRPLRYKLVSALPDHIKSQYLFEQHVRGVLAARRGYDGQPVKFPELGDPDRKQLPLYTYITNQAEADAFARELRFYGISENDIKSMKIAPGKAYEDIKALNFDQLVGASTRASNTLNTRTAQELVNSFMQRIMGTATRDLITPDFLRENLARMCKTLHKVWLDDPSNAWAKSDEILSLPWDHPKFDAENKLKDLDAIENAFTVYRAAYKKSSEKARYARVINDLDLASYKDHVRRARVMGAVVSDPVVEAVRHLGEQEITGLRDRIARAEALRTRLTSEKRSRDVEFTANQVRIALVRSQQSLLRTLRRTRHPGERVVIYSHRDRGHVQNQEVLSGIRSAEHVRETLAPVLVSEQGTPLKLHAFLGLQGEGIRNAGDVLRDLQNKLWSLHPDKDAIFLGEGPQNSGLNELVLRALAQSNKKFKIVYADSPGADFAAHGRRPSLKLANYVLRFTSPEAMNRAIALSADHLHIYGQDPSTRAVLAEAELRANPPVVDKARTLRDPERTTAEQNVREANDPSLRLLGGAHSNTDFRLDHYPARPLLPIHLEKSIQQFKARGGDIAHIMHDAWVEQRPYVLEDGTPGGLYLSVINDEGMPLKLETRVQGSETYFKSPQGKWLRARMRLKENGEKVFTREPRFKPTGQRSPQGEAIKEDIANTDFKKLSPANQDLNNVHVEAYLEIALNPRIAPEEKGAVAHNEWVQKNQVRLVELETLLRTARQTGTPDGVAIKKLQDEADYLKTQLDPFDLQRPGEKLKARLIMERIAQHAQSQGLPVSLWGIDDAISSHPLRRRSSDERKRILAADMTGDQAFAFMGDLHLLKAVQAKTFTEAVAYIERDPDGIFKSIESMARQGQKALRQGGLILLGDIIDAPSVLRVAKTGNEQLRLQKIIAQKLAGISKRTGVPLKMTMGNHDSRLYFKDGKNNLLAQAAYQKKFEALMAEHGIEMLTHRDNEGAFLALKLKNGKSLWIHVSHMPKYSDRGAAQFTGMGNLTRAGVGSEANLAVGPDGSRARIAISADIHVAGLSEILDNEAVNVARVRAMESADPALRKRALDPQLDSFDPGFVEALVNAGLLNLTDAEVTIVRAGTIGRAETRAPNVDASMVFVGQSGLPHTLRYSHGKDGWVLHRGMVELPSISPGSGQVIPIPNK